jgi:multidrug resistance efflux pump
MGTEPTPSFDYEATYSARLLHSNASTKTFLRWLYGILAVVVLAMFLPWQQFVSGKGKVTAIRPQDRPQTVPAAIAGRIEQWFVAEGQYVSKGTPLVQISEVKEKFLDPRLVERLGEQVEGKRKAVDAKRRTVVALDAQIEQLERALQFALEQGRTKIAEYEAAVDAALQDSIIAADRLARRRQLFAEGLASRVDLETFIAAAQKATASLVEKRQGLVNAQLELDAKRAEYGEKIAKARADREKTRAEVGEGDAEVAKLRNEYASMQIRQGFYRILAPQDGYVVRAQQAGLGELVKEGDPIVTVQPANPQLAVELFVKPMDVPLLKRGRKVRLQFDGWPALQFIGWPSVAVGTFGGVITVIDYNASPNGLFRVLVTPDPSDEPWPEQLRIGGGANGWAMLDTVRVWFEIWRQLNGFPPSVQPGDAEAPGTYTSGDASKQG